MTSDDFSIPSTTGIFPINVDYDCDTEHCARVYKASPGIAALQIRSHYGRRADGKRFLIAHACFTRQELAAFRDHINTVLETL